MYAKSFKGLKSLKSLKSFKGLNFKIWNREMIEYIFSIFECPESCLKYNSINLL